MARLPHAVAFQTHSSCSKQHVAASLLTSYPTRHRCSRVSRRLDKVRAAAAAADVEPSSSSSGSTGSWSSVAQHDRGENGAAARDVASAKAALLSAIADTRRGARVDATQRGAIEESQVAVEGYGGEIDYDKLQGTWRLIYTTALDVVPILSIAQELPWPLPGVRVGDIYQRFEGSYTGRVFNIIRFTVPFLLDEQQGITFTVGARFASAGRQTIALTFEDAGVNSVHVSPLLESLLAPAVLPRGWLQHRLLLALRELDIRVPLQAPSAWVTQRSRGVGSYQLTYLDDDLLIGRALSSGGIFIFSKAD